MKIHTGQFYWSSRSRKNRKSINNQQHTEKIVFGGELEEKDNKLLTESFPQNNLIGDEGADKFAKALTINNGLTTLRAGVS